MALLPKGTVNLSYPQADRFYFFDSAGIYNVSLNPGGYGAPNILKSDVIKTELLLKSPSDDEEVLLTDWTYLPTDAAAAEVTCEQYSPDDTEAVADECADCPDDILLTDCEDEEVTCFVDGCWTLHYKVYWTDLANPPYEVTFHQLFYGQVLKQLMDMTKVVKSGMVQNDANWNWEKKLNEAWNDYQRMLLTAQLDDCDCACITNALASVQKKLTEMTNRV